jgi:AhpD family alkylhydroperoxidase
MRISHRARDSIQSGAAFPLRKAALRRNWAGIEMGNALMGEDNPPPGELRYLPTFPQNEIIHLRSLHRGVSMYDLKNLAKLKTIDANAPEAMKAFWAFDKAAMAAGAIPVKYKELMALAVAFTTQCPYCIDIHAKKARAAEATEQEIAEVVVIAAALRAGAAITHGTHAIP